MWYWDYTPSGWNHTKKPLTKKQLQKIQHAYSQVEKITLSIKEQEEKEKKDSEIILQDIL